MVDRYLSDIYNKYRPDVMITNTENLTSGRGPALKHLDELEALGFDVFTGGNHIFQGPDDLTEYFDYPDCKQIRPLNYYSSRHFVVPGKGYKIIEKKGARILIVNLLSNTFMNTSVYNPFLAIDELLLSFEEKGEEFDAIFIDFHREATSEMYIMSHFLDGRVSFIAGTHTHVQTNDDHIMPNGTGMICDVGMCGGLLGSIGETAECRLPGALTGGISLFSRRPEQDMSTGVICGVYFEVEDKKCIKIEKIRITEGQHI